MKTLPASVIRLATLKPKLPPHDNCGTPLTTSHLTLQQSGSQFSGFREAEQDLGSRRTIGQVRLWFRTDCCFERNEHLRVIILDKDDLLPRPERWSATVSSNPGTNVSFAVPAVTGQVIRVEHPPGTYEYLSLAEVELEVWE